MTGPLYRFIVAYSTVRSKQSLHQALQKFESESEWTEPHTSHIHPNTLVCSHVWGWLTVRKLKQRTVTVTWEKLLLFLRSLLSSAVGPAAARLCNYYIWIYSVCQYCRPGGKFTNPTMVKAWAALLCLWLASTRCLRWLFWLGLGMRSEIG